MSSAKSTVLEYLLTHPSTTADVKTVVAHIANVRTRLRNVSQAIDTADCVGKVSSGRIAYEKKCKVTGEEFDVSDWELDFLARVSPVFAGRKYPLPPPNIAPEERQRRRLAFRNLRHLHRRTSDLSGRPIIRCMSRKVLTAYTTQKSSGVITGIL